MEFVVLSGLQVVLNRLDKPQLWIAGYDAADGKVCALRIDGRVGCPQIGETITVEINPLLG